MRVMDVRITKAKSARGQRRILLELMTTEGNHDMFPTMTPRVSTALVKISAGTSLLATPNHLYEPSSPNRISRSPLSFEATETESQIHAHGEELDQTLFQPDTVFDDYFLGENG